MKIRQAQASLFGDNGPAAARASAAQPIVGTDPCIVAGFGAGARPNPASRPTVRRPNLKRTRLGKTAKPSGRRPGPVCLFSGPLKLGRASLATRSPSLRSDVSPADPPFHQPTDPPVRRLSGDVAPFRPACIGEIESQVQSPARATRVAIASEKGSKTFWGAALRPILGPRRVKACAKAAGCRKKKTRWENNRVCRPRAKTRPRAPSRFPSA